MATFSAVFIPAGSAEDQSASLAAITATGEIILGKNQLFAINATDDMCIAFGNVGMAAATATNFRIPAGTTATYDTGNAVDRIILYNPGAVSITYYIQLLSRV